MGGCRPSLVLQTRSFLTVPTGTNLTSWEVQRPRCPKSGWGQPWREVPFPFLPIRTPCPFPRNQTPLFLWASSLANASNAHALGLGEGEAGDHVTLAGRGHAYRNPGASKVPPGSAASMMGCTPATELALGGQNHARAPGSTLQAGCHRLVDKGNSSERENSRPDAGFVAFPRAGKPADPIGWQRSPVGPAPPTLPACLVGPRRSSRGRPRGLGALLAQGHSKLRGSANSGSLTPKPDLPPPSTRFCYAY